MELLNELIIPLKAIVADLSADPIGTLVTGRTTAITTTAVLLLIALGLVEALFGLKLLKIELLAFGFGAGFFVGNLLVAIDAIGSLLTESWMELALMGVLGLIFTILAYKFLRIALMLGVAAGIFLFAAPVLTGMLADEMIGKLAAGAVGLVIGSITLKLHKPVVMLLTSFLGAFLVSYAASGFMQEHILDLPFAAAILLAIVFIVGFFFQVSHRKSH